MTFTREQLQRLAAGRILVIGDVMLDHFIWGHVRRISPEAPVPIVEVTREEFYPGGAANVARNISPFSPHTHLMGRVGKDMAADRLRALLIEDKVDPAPLILFTKRCPRSRKPASSARQQQIVRVDREKLLPLTDAELIEVEQRVRDLAPNLDAIILEDYGKGFMTEKLMHLVAKIAAEHQLIVTVDPSPRNPLPWAGVSLVKPNRLEAFAAAGLEDHLLPEARRLKTSELLEVGRVLLSKWNVASVLVTLGEQGMMLFRARSCSAPHSRHVPVRCLMCPAPVTPPSRCSRSRLQPNSRWKTPPTSPTTPAASSSASSAPPP
jgi:rfaE bifunctional protein kinase chain/domain